MFEFLVGVWAWMAAMAVLTILWALSQAIKYQTSKYGDAVSTTTLTEEPQKMQIVKSFVVGAIAVIAVALALLFVSQKADAAYWENTTEREDMMEARFSHLITSMDRGQFITFSCATSDDGRSWYYHRMDFGDYSYIGSGGAKMIVKYGGSRVKKDDGWSIFEGDGSIVDRSFFTDASFKKYVDNIVASGRVRYRVTAYNSNTFDIVFESPSNHQASKLYKACGIE